MKNDNDYRKHLALEVRKEIHGPLVTDENNFKTHVIPDPPNQYFSCGILYPVNSGIQSAEVDETLDNIKQDIDGGDESELNFGNDSRKKHERTVDNIEADEQTDIDLTSQMKPSAISISFIAENATTLNVYFYFATYSKVLDDENKVLSGYKRTQHKKLWKFDYTQKNAPSEKPICRIEEQDILKAKISTRDIGDGKISVTISLINRIVVETSAKPNYRDMIFQPQIIVRLPNGEFYPFIDDVKSLDPELEDLALQYRNVRTYCRGHGCAGEWIVKNVDCAPSRVLSNLIPHYEVPGTKPREEAFEEGSKLSFLFKDYSLIDQALDVARTKIIRLLTAFKKDYEAWLKAQTAAVKNLETKHGEAIGRTSLNISNSIDRLQKGIEYLDNNDDALKAFIIANRAMWMQQCHVKLASRFIDGEEAFNNPTTDLDVRNDQEQAQRAWRPFQLAFVLMNLYSIPSDADIRPVDSDIVDLIWFPTGGGKTEAYLGLAAYSIVYSKLVKYNANPATNVIMRYTLRLLTGQQFSRASTLICALEYLRSNEVNYAWSIENFQRSSTITIGLWVGKSLTPNLNKEAHSKLQNMRRDPDDAKNVFQVLNCPWCKGDLCYRSAHDKANKIKTYHGYDTLPKSKEVTFKCRDTSCPFDQLPIFVVDEQLFGSPPSLLIGTVDKFAQLSWKSETGAFFGTRTGSAPPNLIIQDELHLISGPLGSIVGHYEYLIRAICRKSGFLPKIVASTATIRSASDQVQNLFRSKVNIFPAPGYSYDDNYFSYQSKERGTGRVYVGVFASATPSIVTAERNLAATLLQMPRVFFNDLENFEETQNTSDPTRSWLKQKEELFDPTIDPYGTLVWYFNSLRDLGYAKTLLLQDISEHFKVLQRRYNILPPLTGLKGSIEELTSRADEEEIGLIESALNYSWKPIPTGSKGELPIDVLLATNMISVGFDVSRLGLMLIDGQPKNTAEYIQASSRVGRSNIGPGLVYCLYNHARSRDRSHFENFYSYHQSLYKNVEPTSITPLAPKARERSLPALIVGLVRHVLGLRNPSDFSCSSKQAVLLQLEDYIQDANDFSKDLGSDDVKSEIDRIFERWESRIDIADGDELSWGDMGAKAQETDLLEPFGTETDASQPLKLKLLMSMRNVDGESVGQITQGNNI